MLPRDRGSALRPLRASPTRAGIGFGLVALPLWVGLGYALAPLDREGTWLGPVWAGLLVVLGLLTALAVPGRSGWNGYVVGGVAIAIVAGAVSAILPSEPRAGIPTLTGPIAVILFAVTGAVLILVSSVGYPIATIVRRLRRPAQTPASTEPLSGDIGAH